MTCLECRDLMLEVARCRAAPFVDRRVLAHVAECEGCGLHLEGQRALTAALGAVAREADAQTASPEVESRLMAAFAAEAWPTASGAPSSQRRRSVRLATAAALLLAAGMTAWWGSRPQRATALAPQVAQVSHPATPAPATAAAPVPVPAAVEPPVETRRTHRPVRSAPPAARPSGPVEAVGFVAIPSALGLPAFESGEIVRLGIPVTALPNYGVEIPAGGQASVEADLLIGQDGQARAIRLVAATVDAPRPRQ